MNDMTPTQALAALSELCHSRDDRAALSVIERHVQDMERALEECECLNPIGLLGTGIPCGDWARHTGEVPEGGLCPRCAALSVPAEDAGEPEPTCDECGGPVNARGECRYGHNWPARAALPAREKEEE